MIITAYGIFLFFLVFIIHVGLWRMRKPRNTTVAIIVLFPIGVISAWGVISLIPDTYLSHNLLSDNSIDNSLALLLALALSASYVMTYPALENDSPTLKLVYWIWASNPEGISRQELCGHFSNEALVKPSITEMINERLIKLNGNSLMLTKRGRRLVRFYQAWRKLLRTDIGG